MTITLAPRNTMAPVPRVEISFEAADLPAGTDRVTVWRVANGREFKVRDGIDRVVISAVNMVDVEPDLRGSIIYQAECWAGSTPLGRVALGATEMAWAGGAVIQQPLDPSLSVEAVLKWGTANELARESPGALVFSSGAVAPDYVGFGPRRALQGVDIVLDVAESDRETLHASLGTYAQSQLPIWLIRAPDVRWPAVFFCHVPRLVEVDRSGYGGNVLSYVLKVDEVNPPAAALVISLLSYDDLDVSYASYTAMDAAYASYDIRDRDYSLAGAAG